MTYKQLLRVILLCWTASWAYLVYALVKAPGGLVAATYTNARIGRAGAYGLVKHFYIKVDSLPNAAARTLPLAARMDALKRSSGIDRDYAFGLSRLLLPVTEINRLGTITFYVNNKDLLPDNDNTPLMYYAPTAGTMPAGKTRLIIDVFASLIYRFLYVHVGFLLLALFSKPIHAWLQGSRQQDTPNEAALPEYKWMICFAAVAAVTFLA